jgi:hypothetical protein
MNFDPVGINKQGEHYMKFHTPFSVVEKIQLLQRWILVQSFAYYELNQNIASDFKYDANAGQLERLMKGNPEEANRSRYRKYFYDFFDENEDTHMTSGFDLLERVRKNDKKLYRYIWMDAVRALELKAKYGTNGMS